MNIWQILGIQPTTDKKEIKLAYSIKLKSINHETQVLEFQELRQAYENALLYAGRFAAAGLPPVIADAIAEQNDSGKRELGRTLRTLQSN